ncbi:MAG TPA: hypothetical protein VK992_01150, partial [Candidatus Caenarcaniphilales bacterium]|nr:hypothetical protein [Candidatus Caenarcaniphilales bacterium]
VPVDVATVPALAGSLVRGTAWARSGDGVVAAHTGIGRGTVTLVGFNPADSWLAGTESGRALWRRVLPPAAGPQLNPLMITDDSAFVSALNNLPSIDLPPIEQLFLLLFAYVALIGPINYMVLRRLDKREWAWVTMPALVAIFAVASYGMGASLKGSDVIINEVAIVRAGEGTDRGLGQVYVGVFSPSRRTFDVRVGDGALLTNPGSQNQMGQPELPLDVLFGERSQLRNFEVGFGLLRGFRAEAPTRAPLIEADLRLARGRVEGTVTNRSDRSLEHVAISYAGGVDVLDSLAAGESKEVSIDTSDALMEYQLSERIFGSIPPRDAAQARAVYTRRTVIDQLSGYGSGASGANADAPLLMGWQPGQVLDVELVGERPNRVGDSLFLVPLSMTVDREALFTDRMLVKTVVENNSGEGFVEGTSYFLDRGAMIVEARPGALDGALAVRSLELALAQDDQIRLRGSGTPISPLPEAEQPDQDDPVGEPDDAGAGGFEDLPRFQLFDHGAQRWYEFPEAVSGSTYLINDAQRFVDPSGRVLVRLVNRDNLNEPKYFSLLMRLEGTIE